MEDLVPPSNFSRRLEAKLNLDDALPDHSSLGRNQQRLGIDIFHRFFARAVNLSQEAGLVRGREQYVDAAKVHADADRERDESGRSRPQRRQ